MKKSLCLLLCCIVVITGIFVILNIPVATRQGINYQWHTIRLPLYLKVLDFFDRHFNYKQLVKRIVKDADTDREKVMKIFEWAHQNIKADVPKDWPIIDDHVWYIIVRGYGAKDQFSDVFTTLCNYAAIDAFYSWVYTQDRKQRIPLSFVRIDKKWVVFDPYHGIYFKARNDELADVEAIRSGSSWTIEALDEKPTIDYAIYFDNLPSIERMELKRSNIQSPLRRIMFEVKEWLKVK